MTAVSEVTESTTPLTEQRYVVPLVLVTSLFFLWAIGVNLNDILIPHLKKALDLTDFQSSLIQTAFFGGYFLMALPAGWLMRRLGYRRGILSGLALCALGTLLFQPAATARWYPFFLLALFVMACGQCVLEVAANPYVTVLGPPASAAARLNMAQAFNALGAVLTPFFGAKFILSGVEHSRAELSTMTPAAIDAWRSTEAAGVKGPYLAITALFVAVGIMIALSKLPEVKEPGVGSGRGLAAAWRHAHLRRGVLAQFCLSARYPFEHHDRATLRAAHLGERPPRLRDVPVELATAVERALAKSRTDRWPDALSFAAAMTRSLDAPRRRRARWLVA